MVVLGGSHRSWVVLGGLIWFLNRSGFFFGVVVCGYGMDQDASGVVVCCSGCS